MSHQAFFMMPATIFCSVYKSRARNLLLVGLLSTMSVAALILFAMARLIYLRKKLLHNLLRVAPLIFIVTLALYLGSNFIISKMSTVFVSDALVTGEQTKEVSAANILLGIEVLKFISWKDLLLGYGYFGLAENIPRLLYDSSFYPYFQMIDTLDEPKSVGLLNLIFYFGLLQCSI